MDAFEEEIDVLSNISNAYFLFDNSLFLAQLKHGVNPRSLTSIALLAKAFLRNHQFHTCVEFLDSRMPFWKTDCETNEVYYLYAVAAFHVGHFDRARSSLECLVRDPRHALHIPPGIVYYLLGRVYARLRRRDLAIQALEKTISYQPLLWPAYVLLCDLGAEVDFPETSSLGDLMQQRDEMSRRWREGLSIEESSDMIGADEDDDNDDSIITTAAKSVVDPDLSFLMEDSALKERSELLERRLADEFRFSPIRPGGGAAGHDRIGYGPGPGGAHADTVRVGAVTGTTNAATTAGGGHPFPPSFTLASARATSESPLARSTVTPPIRTHHQQQHQHQQHMEMGTGTGDVPPPVRQPPRVRRRRLGGPNTASIVEFARPTAPAGGGGTGGGTGGGGGPAFDFGVPPAMPPRTRRRNRNRNRRRQRRRRRNVVDDDDDDIDMDDDDDDGYRHDDDDYGDLDLDSDSESDSDSDREGDMVGGRRRPGTTTATTTTRTGTGTGTTTTDGGGGGGAQLVAGEEALPMHPSSETDTRDVRLEVGVSGRRSTRSSVGGRASLAASAGAGAGMGSRRGVFDPPDVDLAEAFVGTGIENSVMSVDSPVRLPVGAGGGADTATTQQQMNLHLKKRFKGRLLTAPESTPMRGTPYQQRQGGTASSSSGTAADDTVTSLDETVGVDDDDKSLVMAPRDFAAVLNVLHDVGQSYKLLSFSQSDKAIVKLKELPPQILNTAWVQRLVARCYYELAMYNESHQYFKRVIAQEPYSKEDLVLFSTVLWHLKDRVEIASLVSHVKKAAPNSPEFYACQANAFSLQGKHKMAMESFHRALALPGSIHPYIQVLAGLQALETDEYEFARRQFLDVVATNARFHAAYYGLGILHYTLKDFESAKHWFQKALQNKPTSSIYLSHHARALQALGERVAALLAMEAAVRVDPRNAFARLKLAEMYLDAQRFDAALRIAETLKAEYSTEPAVHRLLASLYRARGDRGAQTVTDQLTHHLMGNDQANPDYGDGFSFSGDGTKW